MSGIVDGAYLGYTFGSQLERRGYRILADLAKLGIPFQGVGIMARRSFLDQSLDPAGSYSSLLANFRVLCPNCDRKTSDSRRIKMTKNNNT
jgi:hypothetical protein